MPLIDGAMPPMLPIQGSLCQILVAVAVSVLGRSIVIMRKERALAWFRWLLLHYKYLVTAHCPPIQLPPRTFTALSSQHRLAFLTMACAALLLFFDNHGVL